MSTDERNDPERDNPDGPGEAVIDEPTEHALDPEPDPNTEWEKRAAEDIEDRESEAE